MSTTTRNGKVSRDELALTTEKQPPQRLADRFLQPAFTGGDGAPLTLPHPSVSAEAPKI